MITVVPLPNPVELGCCNNVSQTLQAHFFTIYSEIQGAIKIKPNNMKNSARARERLKIVLPYFFPTFIADPDNLAVSLQHFSYSFCE